MQDILVSIWCITYNHELYIRDAIEGFLSQKTRFRYEIIIHDDASTDHTADIVKEYEKKYPEIIQGIYQKENQYSQNYPNTKWLQELQGQYCNGKYIAICEGDDFWVDIHKLQIQIDWLEKRPEFCMVAHNAICWEYNNEIIKSMSPYKKSKEVSHEEIIMQYHGNIPTASLVIRADTIQMDDFFLETGIGDWMQQLHCIIQGKIFYFDRIMSVYRAYHDNSWTIDIWNDPDRYFDHCLRMIEFFEKYNEYTNGEYKKYIVSRSQLYVYIVIDMNRRGLDFFEQCNRLDINNKFKFHSYIGQMKRIFMQLNDENYYDENLEQFIKNYSHIIIFGAGDYASKIAVKLNKKRIQFDGFAVSDRTCEKTQYMGKAVWEMNNIPFNKKSVGIIIAIKPVKWYQLVDVLEENQFTEYTCPFLFKDE